MTGEGDGPGWAMATGEGAGEDAAGTGLREGVAPARAGDGTGESGAGLARGAGELGATASVGRDVGWDCGDVPHPSNTVGATRASRRRQLSK